eukprot:1234340-Prymnesium_polylepis.1
MGSRSLARASRCEAARRAHTALSAFRMTTRTQTQTTAAAARDATVKANIIEASRPAHGAPQLTF